jgi:hypothetical protein
LVTTHKQKLELNQNYEKLHIYFFKLILKKKKTHPKIKWVVNPEANMRWLNVTGVVAQPPTAQGWSPKPFRGGATTPNLFCGWPTTPMGGQATHFIFHIFFIFLILF